jgi:uncharacterized membrane protein
VNKPPQPPDSLARAVHWALLLGLACSVLLMLAGLVVALMNNQPRPEQLITKLPDLLSMAGQGNGVAFMELGVLTLTLTPVLRVLVLAVGWAIRRERRMALVAFVVLGLLALSVALSTG